MIAPPSTKSIVVVAKGVGDSEIVVIAERCHDPRSRVGRNNKWEREKREEKRSEREPILLVAQWERLFLEREGERAGRGDGPGG